VRKIFFLSCFFFLLCLIISEEILFSCKCCLTTAQIRFLFVRDKKIFTALNIKKKKIQENDEKIFHVKFISSRIFLTPFFSSFLHTARRQEIIKMTEQLIEAINNGDFDAYT
jgi:hypothetical protein